MNSNIQNLAVQIVRFVDGSFPGWVACEFEDADGFRHTLIDRWPIFTAEMLDEASVYPRPGSAPCEVLWRGQDDRGRDLVRVSTANPVAMESTAGLSEFVVLPAQLTVDSPAHAPR